MSHPFDEFSQTPAGPKKLKFGVGKRQGVMIGFNAYRASDKTGTMIFRKQFLLSDLEPPCDAIRRACTDMEFIGEINEPAMHMVELNLQRIEAQIDIIRLMIRKR